MPDQNDYRKPPYTNTQQKTTQTRQPMNQNFQQAPPPPTPSNPPRTVTAGPPNPPPVTDQQVPSTVASPYYLAGYLQQYIGKVVRVEFSLGTSGVLNDRVGILHEVGASYIVLRQYPTNDLLIGDLYSIKFVNVFAEHSIAENI